MIAEIEVQIALEPTIYLYVGDEKELVVCSARKSDAHRLADGATGAVAAANIGCVRLLRLAVAQNCGADGASILREACQLGSPFDGAAGRLQLSDEKALMIVLRIGQRKRIG